MAKPHLIRPIQLGLGGITPVYGGWYRQPDEAQRIYQVQGKRATSLEYNVALALDQVKLEYWFQLAVGGGRQHAFGIVLDFLVLTVPLPTPVWVNGAYFHRGPVREKDIRQQSLVVEAFHGQVAPAVELWEWQTDTFEHALMTVRNKFGV